jgi:ribosomal protein S10
MLYTFLFIMICKIHLKSVKPDLIEIYGNFFEKLAVSKGFVFKKQGLPTQISRISVLRSPHVHKKAKDHYEVRTRQALFTIIGQNSLIFVEELLKMKPIELACKITILN